MVLDDVPAFYRATSPNKFFDYIACGLPVLNNYPGWLAELIRKYNLGIPVPPRDPVAFAEALIRLADQPALVAAMGSSARKFAEARFSRSVLADQWRAVLENTRSRYERRRCGYLRKQVYAFFKGVVDRVFAVVALVALSPLLAVTAVMVLFRIGSPVFFRQQRPGYLGQPFLLWKFRTMTNCRDSSSELLPMFSDSLFGRWLRSTSIDGEILLTL